jgi:hypothetical protein
MATKDLDPGKTDPEEDQDLEKEPEIEDPETPDPESGDPVEDLAQAEDELDDVQDEILDIEIEKENTPWLNSLQETETRLLARIEALSAQILAAQPKPAKPQAAPQKKPLAYRKSRK